MLSSETDFGTMPGTPPEGTQDPRVSSSHPCLKRQLGQGSENYFVL